MQPADMYFPQGMAVLCDFFQNKPNGFVKKPYRKHGLPRKDEKEMLLLTTYVRLIAVTIGWCVFLHRGDFLMSNFIIDLKGS